MADIVNLEAVRALVDAAAPCACCPRFATHARKTLCRRCYMAVYRATKRGEGEAEAIEHRRLVLARRARGWVR